MESLWLWIGVLGFVAATAFFIYLGPQAPPGSRHFFVITAVITGIAGFSYLMMATGAGSYLAAGGRIFYWFRYVDWIFTTPLLLLDLILLALPAARRNLNLIFGLLAVDVFMILTGLLAGSRISGVGRGFWFLVSTAALIVLFYLFMTRVFPAQQSRPRSVQALFRTLAVLTVALWALYPVVWLLGTEGFGAVGSTTEVFLFLVLDFLAKIGFGLLLLTNRQALADAGSAQARPSRVR